MGKQAEDMNCRLTMGWTWWGCDEIMNSGLLDEARCRKQAFFTFLKAVYLNKSQVALGHFLLFSVLIGVFKRAPKLAQHLSTHRDPNK